MRCYICGNDVPEGIGDWTDQGFICRVCQDSMDYLLCEKCGRKYRRQDMIEWDDRFYCKNCVKVRKPTVRLKPITKFKGGAMIPRKPLQKRKTIRDIEPNLAKGIYKATRDIINEETERLNKGEKLGARKTDEKIEEAANEDTEESENEKLEREKSEREDINRQMRGEEPIGEVKLFKKMKEEDEETKVAGAEDTRGRVARAEEPAGGSSEEERLNLGKYKEMMKEIRTDVKDTEKDEDVDSLDELKQLQEKLKAARLRKKKKDDEDYSIDPE